MNQCRICDKHLLLHETIYCEKCLELKYKSSSNKKQRCPNCGSTNLYNEPIIFGLSCRNCPWTE